MAKIRLTKVMKNYITEELMAPIDQWYDERHREMRQERDEDLRNLFVASDEYAEKLATDMAVLGYVTQDVNTIKSRLRREVEYICNSRFVEVREDKNLSELNKRFNEKKQEVDRALVQIELECALGTDKEEFMSLLNSYKEKLQEGL